MSEIVPGLVSITFRELDVSVIATMAAEAGLSGIEWGGDVHVPVGDFPAAELARTCSADAGLEITSYGSYYRADTSLNDFQPILDTAVALGAPGIRIWAGRTGSASTSPEDRINITETIARAADIAADKGIQLNVEYHPNTLTDTVDSALELFADVAKLRNADEVPLTSYYQPYRGTPAAEAAATVRALLPYLSHVHVFSWDADGTRLPLSGRADLWKSILAELANSPRRHHAQLEFVADNAPEHVRADAATLHNLISEVSR